MTATAPWGTRRLKTLARIRLSNVDKKAIEGEQPVRLCNYTDVYYRDQIDNDVDFMAATASAEQVRAFALQKGDVLITKDSESWDDIAIPAVVAERVDAVCGYHLALIRPQPDIAEGRFLFYSLKATSVAAHFKVRANGVTRFGVGAGVVGDTPVPIPPIRVQAAIADYLDAETARIDALVDRKERFIELLFEKRTALITGAVTKGLDPNVEMKDSGVEWVDRFPTSWRLQKLKFYGPRTTVGIVVTPARYYVDEGVPAIRSFNIAGASIDSRDIAYISDEGNRRNAKSILQANDIVVVRTGKAGAAAIVTPEFEGANCIDLLIVRRAEQLDPKYLWYFLNSRAAEEQVVLHSVGSIQAHYNTCMLANMLVSAPRLDEQHRIVDHLDAQTAEIDALVDKTHESIELLKEYRTALISAAVTGRIDVAAKQAEVVV